MLQGESFPAMVNACGSISLGNISPDSIVDGIKSKIENMDVFAVSFTANPMILAIIKTFALINTPLSQSQAIH